jgi:hypothetical protein
VLGSHRCSICGLTLELSGGEAVRLERVVRCHSALSDAVEPKVVKRFCLWIVFDFEVAGAAV